VALTLRGRALAPPERVLGSPTRLALLIAMLPLFGETFHLITDIPPFYALAKIWAFLLLPLACLGYARLRLPARDLFVVALAYVVPIPPLMAMLYFGSTYLEALTTIVKIVPITFYFSMSYVLFLLRPSQAELRSAVLILGYATFILMAVLWVAMPASAYKSYYGIQTVFVGNDDVRGNRIMMPMLFGMLLQFHLARRIQIERRWRDILLLVLFYGLMVTIYKERVPIIFSLLVVGIGFLEAIMRSRALALLLTLCLGTFTAAIGSIATSVDAVVNGLGGSLMVRIMSDRLAWDYMRDHPLRWLFGSGGTTAYAEMTLSRLFRNNAFYLSDIGWLGVVFEYGVIGAGLIAAVHIAALRITRGRATPRDPFSMALADYAFYLLPASLIYSLALLPGEMAMVTAMAVYWRRSAERDAMIDFVR
jgi:hypothetical protein